MPSEDKRLNEIIRIERRRNNFVMIDKGFAENPNLSYKAKGIMVYLLSKPDDWKVIVKDLVNHGKDGKTAVYSGLKELSEQGYYRKVPVKDKRGRITHWEGTVSELPIFLKNEENEAPPANDEKDSESKNVIDKGFSPLPGFPEMDNPDMEKPYLENRERTNNYITNNDFTKNYGTNKNISPPSAGVLGETPQGVCRTAEAQQDQEFEQTTLMQPSIKCQEKQQGENLKVKMAQGTGSKPVNHSKTLVVEQWFDQFWTAYPRKVGKKDAKTAWIKIWDKKGLDEALFSSILNGLEAAKQWWTMNQAEPKHIPHASNWLNKERWKDELDLSTIPMVAPRPHSGGDSASKGENPFMRSVREDAEIRRKTVYTYT